MSKYNLTLGARVQVRAYAMNATGWQTVPSPNNFNNITVDGLKENTKTILSLSLMSQEYVSFVWSSDAFSQTPFKSTGLVAHGNYYEVFYDEGQRDRSVSNFVSLATNLPDTGYTYRNFNRQYQKQDPITGDFKINYRFYVVAKSACGTYPQSNLLEVLVSIRDKNALLTKSADNDDSDE